MYTQPHRQNWHTYMYTALWSTGGGGGGAWLFAHPFCYASACKSCINTCKGHYTCTNLYINFYVTHRQSEACVGGGCDSSQWNKRVDEAGHLYIFTSLKHLMVLLRCNFSSKTFIACRDMQLGFLCVKTLLNNAFKCIIENYLQAEW